MRVVAKGRSVAVDQVFDLVGKQLLLRRQFWGWSPLRPLEFVVGETDAIVEMAGPGLGGDLLDPFDALVVHKGLARVALGDELVVAADLIEATLQPVLCLGAVD